MGKWQVWSPKMLREAWLQFQMFVKISSQIISFFSNSIVEQSYWKYHWLIRKIDNILFKFKNELNRQLFQKDQIREGFIHNLRWCDNDLVWIMFVFFFFYTGTVYAKAMKLCTYGQITQWFLNTLTNSYLVNREQFT